MARVLVTGSADGLGRLAAQLLVEGGHHVVLHARSERRASDAHALIPEAEATVFGDLSSIAEVRGVAAQVNALRAFDAVIHNAGVGYQERQRGSTVDGLPVVFAVNSLAPYMLTALITPPRRLIYVSSGMHHGASANLDDLQWKQRRWSGAQAYAESKLHDVILAFAVARLWQGVLSNALEPGWVATKMGGPRAPDDLEAGRRTQVWLATSDEPPATVSGGYFYHLKPRKPNPEALDPVVQERFLSECTKLSGVPFPTSSAG